MKNIFKLSLLSGLLLFLGACNDITDLEGLLNDPNAANPDNAEIGLVFNNAMLQFENFTDEVSDETMPYVRMVAMTGGNQYLNQDSPASFDFTWDLAYARLLPDLNTVIDGSDAGGFTLQAGAARVLKAYVLFTLVDMFGDVPFSEALLGVTVPSPNADDDEAVYDAALGILDEAIANLRDPRGTFSNDLYFGGDADKWLQTANSLKLRYFVQTRLVNASESTSGINSLISDGNLIDEKEDDFQFQYGSNRVAPDSRHPYYADGYENGGPSWYMSNYYMWLMFGDKDTEDPRLRYYFYRQDCDEVGEDQFTLACPAEPYPFHWPSGYPFCTASGPTGDPLDNYGGYWGRDHGDDSGIPPDDLKRTAWGLYPAGGSFDANDCAQVSNGGTDGGRGVGIRPILLASWVNFMRAEAALTLGTSDDARDQLEMGVRKSIEKVMSFEDIAPVDEMFKPSMEQIEDYVAEVLDRYDSADDDDDRLNVIMTEYLLALHGNGLDGYNSYRRTCKPTGLQPTLEENPGPFARSLWYPSSYVNRNANASQKSDLTTPVFWDTNPAGCVN